MNQFSLPESVHRYFVDSRVRSAVELLLASKGGSRAEEADWSELPDFYRAQLAAHQTKIEWALAMEELWRVVWNDLVDGWRALLPQEQARENSLSVNVDYLWREGEFDREFRRGRFVLHLSTMLTVDDGYWISAGLWTVDDVPLFSSALEGTHLDGEYLHTDPVPVGSTKELELGGVKAAASRIMAAVERLAQ
jgi:hypothetical protein